MPPLSLFGVSIHAPTGGATCRSAVQQPQGSFQSTRPRGARHWSDIVDNNIPTVSIHAPTGGATRHAITTEQRKEVSIHAPTGARPKLLIIPFLIPTFQSTRLRGARRRHTPPAKGSNCFNPRAHGGRDFEVFVQYIIFPCFNPRAHGGRDRCRP